MTNFENLESKCGQTKEHILPTSTPISSSIITPFRQSGIPLRVLDGSMDVDIQENSIGQQHEIRQDPAVKVMLAKATTLFAAHLMYDVLQVFYREKLSRQKEPSASAANEVGGTSSDAANASAEDNLAVIVPGHVAIAAVNEPLFDFLTSKNMNLPNI